MYKSILLYASLVLFSFGHAQGLKDHLPEGKYIGTAINNQFLEFRDDENPPGYIKTVKKEFNCIVPENAFKSGYLLPNRPKDPFNLTIKDFDKTGLSRVGQLLKLAKNQNMKVRGHAFIWYNQAPKWLNEEAPNWSNEQIYKFAAEYIRVFGGYCKGRVDEWDVVNEGINDSEGNTGFRKANTWYRGVDDFEDFFAHCFKVARETAPEAKLFYNDYNIETSFFTKSDFMQKMVRRMVEKKVPIDGVGLQSHFTSGPDCGEFVYHEVAETIDYMAELGLLCNITELDLRICKDHGEQALKEQQEEFREFTRLFLSKKNCNSLLVWGVSDKGSWIPYTFPGCRDALLWDENMNKKPAYFGVMEGLNDPKSPYFLEMDKEVPNEPYLGHNMKIPGIIEAENYDKGGQGSSFKDRDAENQGGAYREDMVDITPITDGYALGWNMKGEWLEYSVDVKKEGNYTVLIKAAVGRDKGLGKASLIVEKNYLVEDFPFKYTGGWNDYQNFEIKDINLKPGKQILKLKIEDWGMNIDYLKFIRASE